MAEFSESLREIGPVSLLPFREKARSSRVYVADALIETHNVVQVFADQVGALLSFLLSSAMQLSARMRIAPRG